MSRQNHNEQEASFDLTGPTGTLRVDLGGGTVRILNGRSEISIPRHRLRRVEHSPMSWRFGSCRPGLRIRFWYSKGRGEAKAEIALFADDPRTLRFTRALENRFREQVSLEPNEGEKNRILSRNRRGVYGLHDLHIWTPAGIVLGILLVSILVLSIILAEPMPVQAVSGRTLQRSLLVLFSLSLMPAVLMVLMAVRVFMTIRTDSDGLVIRWVFGGKRLTWREVEIGEPGSGVFNVHRGLFCFYSDRVNVVSSQRLVEIPLRNGRESFTLRLNLEEAAPFVRELYYRGKVTLETARKTGAFL